MKKSKNKNLAKLKKLCEKRDSINKLDYHKHDYACRAIWGLMWELDDKNNLILGYGSIVTITKNLPELYIMDIEYFLENYVYCYDYRSRVQASYAYCPIELKKYCKQSQEKYDKK